MEYFSKKNPIYSKDYKLYEEVGEGVTATVYRAFCIPFNEIVADKVLDLKRCKNDLVCRLFSYQKHDMHAFRHMLIINCVVRLLS